MEGLGVGWQPGKTDADKEDSEKDTGKEETKDFDAAAAMFEKRQNSVEGIMSKVRSSSRRLFLLPSSFLIFFRLMYCCST